MARAYHLSFARRLANAAISPLVRLGLGAPHTYILSVRGRRTGKRYSTPVTLVEDGERWLVAPYGERGWVKNARAAGCVELSRGGKTETFALSELAPEEAAPLLREYVRRVRVARPFFDAPPEAPVAAFAAEAGRHPVFLLRDRT
jgi:deazaflavin-dependent oxidoreductase (nitroreductase family)